MIDQFLSVQPSCSQNPRFLYEIQSNFTYLNVGTLDQLGPWHKFVSNSTKPTCLEITGY
jgi:hypothetical protein